MSEFKFACPACGQHIKCASAQSGTEMACPTCFRKLVVPQSPREASGKYILTAAEVQTRPPGLGNGTVAPTAPRKEKSFPFAAVFLVLLLVGAAAGAWAFRDKLLPHRSPAPPAPPAPTVAGGPDQAWTLSLKEAQIPDAPATGRVHGAEFRLERATITGGLLNLRQGPRWPPDLGVTVYLFADQAEQLAGRSIVVEPGRDRSPRITLRWKDESDHPVTQDLRSGYLLKVDFGQPADGHLPGRIYLATPDDANSHVTGTFKAEIRRPKPKTP